MKKWQCTVCGYIHEGAEPPEKCPVCSADRSKFTEVTAVETSAEQLESSARAGVTATGSLTAEPPRDPPGKFKKITRLILKNHLHPISVHSPNGIVPVAVVFLLLAVVFQSTTLESAAYLNMIVVFLSMPLVLLTGYLTWQKKYNGVKTTIFKIKIAASCFATAILFGLIVWKTVQPNIFTSTSSDRWVFLMWALLMLASVGLAGHLGGKLVFGKRK